MDKIEFEEDKLKPSESLQVVIDNLWTAIKGFVDKYKKQVQLNNELKEEKSLLLEEISSLNEKVNSLEEQIKQHKEQYSAETIKEYEEKIAQLEDENRELQLYYEEYKKQKEFLEGSLFGTTDYVDKAQELETQLKLAQEDIVKKNIVINELNKEILNHKEKIEELTNIVIVLKEKEERLQVAEAKINELQNENGEKQNLLEQYEEEIQHLQSELLELREIKLKFENSFQEQTELEKNLEQVVLEKLEKERELERLSTKLKNLENEFTAQKQEKDSLLQTLHTIFSDEIAARCGLEFSGRTFADFERFSQQLPRKLSELFETIEKLSSENETIKVELNGLKIEQDGKIQQLEEEIIFHKNRIAGLEVQLTAKEKELFDIRKNFEELINENKTLKEGYHNLKLEKEFLESELQKYKLENETRRNQIEELVGQLEIERKTIEELNIQIENLTSEIIDLKRAKNEIDVVYSNLFREVEQKNEQIRELTQYKNEFYKLQGEINSLKQINRELKELNKVLNEEKIELQKKIFSLNREKNELQDNLLKAIQDKEKIEILYNDKILEYRDLNEELMKVKLSLQEKEKTKSILIEQITDLINQIDNLIEIEN